MLNITMILLFIAALALLAGGVALFSSRLRAVRSQEKIRQQAAFLRDLGESDSGKR